MAIFMQGDPEVLDKPWPWTSLGLGQALMYLQSVLDYIREDRNKELDLAFLLNASDIS